MNTTVDINTDLKDCRFLRINKIVGGKLIIYVIPNYAAVDCAKCEDELAVYHCIIVTAEEKTDLSADFCKSCFKAAHDSVVSLPIAVIH